MSMPKNSSIKSNYEQKMVYLMADNSVSLRSCFVSVWDKISSEFLIFCILILSVLIFFVIAGIEKMNNMIDMQIMEVSTRYLLFNGSM